jgi:hypothetical protein
MTLGVIFRKILRTNPERQHNIKLEQNVKIFKKLKLANFLIIRDIFECSPVSIFKYKILDDCVDGIAFKLE